MEARLSFEEFISFEEFEDQHHASQEFYDRLWQRLSVGLHRQREKRDKRDKRDKMSRKERSL